MLIMLFEFDNKVSLLTSKEKVEFVDYDDMRCGYIRIFPWICVDL